MRFVVEGRKALKQVSRGHCRLSSGNVAAFRVIGEVMSGRSLYDLGNSSAEGGWNRNTWTYMTKLRVPRGDTVNVGIQNLREDP